MIDYRWIRFRDSSASDNIVFEIKPEHEIYGQAIIGKIKMQATDLYKYKGLVNEETGKSLDEYQGSLFSYRFDFYGGAEYCKKIISLLNSNANLKMGFVISNTEIDNFECSVLAKLDETNQRTKNNLIKMNIQIDIKEMLTLEPRLDI